MALLVLFTGTISKAQYDTLRKEVHWEDKLPPGALFHAASFDDAGQIHAADVWESAEQMNDFVGTRLMPAMQKLGIAPPSVVMYPIHNLNTYSGLDKYRV